MRLLEIVIAFLLPPLAVALKEGLDHKLRKVLIALVLQLVAHIPGVIYALWVITREPTRA
ncbi:MAG: Proteolipid rane potential modulator [Pseudonocardiales bacterium]|jgi:uncharacterized membrane protein YqaE (UPF0057 family)|nr:Proteolipid rane potential modulator [Pseudonocardiales bacterium]MDT7704424.1 Proteolipid rane potential modulator [Pseudonocardiales bacterium]